MSGKRKPVKKVGDKSRFVWDEDPAGNPEFEVIRYDKEARDEMIAALLAESREIAQSS